MRSWNRECFEVSPSSFHENSWEVQKRFARREYVRKKLEFDSGWYENFKADICNSRSKSQICLTMYRFFFLFLSFTHLRYIYYNNETSSFPINPFYLDSKMFDEFCSHFNIILILNLLIFLYSFFENEFLIMNFYRCLCLSIANNIFPKLKKRIF